MSKWKNEPMETVSTGAGARRIVLAFLLAAVATCAISNKGMSNLSSMVVRNGSEEAIALATTSAIERGAVMTEPTAAPAGIVITAVPTITAWPTTTPAPTSTAWPTATPQPTATPMPTATPQPTADLAPIVTRLAMMDGMLDETVMEVKAIKQELADDKGDWWLGLGIGGGAAVLLAAVLMTVRFDGQPKPSSRIVTEEPTPTPHLADSFFGGVARPLPPANTFTEKNEENVARLMTFIQLIPDWQGKNMSELARLVWQPYTRQGTPPPQLAGNWWWLMRQALDKLEVSTTTSTTSR